MTETPEWRNEATEPVLRLLYQAGIGVSPGSIVANLDVRMNSPPAPETIRAALEGLEDEGHVRRLDATGEYYVLTGHGRDYVETAVDQEAFGFIE
ncbi:hypothetical protein [Haloparvum sp. PAK95]|uniref:hypothetical protein n=1 Tax=Haloparvum sp. PAK95 TaxID=3418962 RepID=UPI003D2F4F34